MDTKSEKLNGYLSSIIKKNEDAVKGYQKASEHADSAHLTHYFQNKLKERQDFLNELKSDVSSHSLTNLDNDGSTQGALHRGWMDVKAFFSADDDEAMLEEAIKGDEAAVEEYEEVLGEDDLPMSTANLLRRQVATIKKDLTEINSMEDLK